MEWTRGATIGRGSTATVSLATTVSGELFAVKSTELSCSLLLQTEQHFLSKLSYPRIVKYIGFDVTHENNQQMYNLFMEYVPSGTLYDAIKRNNNGGRLDEPLIRSYTRQILQGVNYLHLNGLAHCDIKSHNVLIGADGAKIADLGCAKLVSNGATSAFSGTPALMAPEVARGEEQGFAADVWAVGCTVIEMATGSFPWSELKDPVSALYRIGFSGDLPEIPSWLSEKAKDFLSNCLRRDPEERWAAKELLEHPFLDESEAPHDSKKVNMSSPSTVLDQGFWDSLEMSENPMNLTDKILCSSSNSPAERINKLIGSTFSTNSWIPNWTFDDDWITVRSNHTEDDKKCCVENDVILVNEPSSAATGISLDSYEAELGSLILNEEEDLLFEFSLENNGNFHSISTRRGADCDSFADGFVLKSLNFETGNENSCFLQCDQFLDFNLKPVLCSQFLYVLFFLCMFNFLYVTSTDKFSFSQKRKKKKTA